MVSVVVVEFLIIGNGIGFYLILDFVFGYV